MYFHHLASALSCALFVASVLPSAADVQQTPQKTGQKQTAGKVGQYDPHLTDALAQWLSNGNKAEIELGKLAEGKAQSPEVKEFAKQMVSDHTAYLKKLSRFTTEYTHAATQVERKTFEDSADKPRPIIEEAKDLQPKEQEVGYRGGEHATMEKIGNRAGELHLQMSKDLLNKYQGYDFDMAYVGQQIAAHTQMLANLKAMEENTTGEFQSVVKEGAKTTQQHLNHAKELSTQLQKQAGQKRQGEDRQ